MGQRRIGQLHFPCNSGLPSPWTEQRGPGRKKDFSGNRISKKPALVQNSLSSDPCYVLSTTRVPRYSRGLAPTLLTFSFPLNRVLSRKNKRKRKERVEKEKKGGRWSGGGRIYERRRSSGLRPFCFVTETSLPCGRFRSSKPNKFRSIADRQWRVLGIGSHGDRPQQYVQCTATSWKFPRRRTPFLPSTLAFAFFLAFFPSFLPSSLSPSLVAALSISWCPFVRYSAFLTSISPSLPFSNFSLFSPPL